jgi:Transposase
MSRPDPKSRRFPCKNKRPSSRPSIGIDWADRKHDVCLQIPGAPDREASVLEHRPRVIDAWARQLRERFGGRPIAVCLELAQGPIVSALLEYEFVVIFPVNPSTLATYRRAFVPSGAKDDPTDAALALELLRCHPEKLAPLRRKSDDMRALRRLVEARRDLVQDRVRVTNRLTFTLNDYFLQIVDWFRDKETEVFAAFLERWPSLQAAERARRDTIVAFFHRTHYNESRYLTALQKRQSPLIKFAAAQPS